MKTKSIEEIAAERGQGVDIAKMADEISSGIGPGCGLVASHRDGCCATCSKAVDPATGFTDELSRREWEITRMCQACQDELFKEPEEDEEEDEEQETEH